MLFLLSGIFVQDASGSVDEVQALQHGLALAFFSGIIQSHCSFLSILVTQTVSSQIPESSCSCIWTSADAVNSEVGNDPT